MSDHGETKASHNINRRVVMAIISFLSTASLKETGPMNFVDFKLVFVVLVRPLIKSCLVYTDRFPTLCFSL